MRRKRQLSKVPNNRWSYVLLGGLLAGLWGLMVVFVDPMVVRDALFPGSYSPFFILLWGSLFFFTYSLTLNYSRSFVWSAMLTFYMVLRLFDMGYLVNGLLLGGLVIALEAYWYWKDEAQES